MPVICHVLRKSRPAYFSIERIFSLVHSVLKDKVTIKQLQVPHARLLPWNVLHNFQVIRKVHADVYHVTGDVHYLTLGLPASRTILTIHDCVFMYRSRGIKRWMLKQLFLTWPVRHCKVITTISEESRREIIKYTGCSPDKVVVVPNPVDSDFYYQQKEFNETQPVILFVGTAPHKNLDRVIEAITGMNCVLDIVGRIPQHQKEMLAKHKINYHESFNISAEQLAAKYAAADLLLFPSIFEGFGLPIVEAQKSGRPVITSNYNPMQEVAGKGACLIDPYDVTSIREGINRIINDASYRDCLVQEGFENIKQFLPERIADLYRQQYVRIISTSKNTPT
jgi:glycosyltransferase involved in cell wall biosynthesis